MKLYGLKNCDACKKALKAIKNAGKNIEFIDIRDNYMSLDQGGVSLQQCGGGCLAVLMTKITPRG